MPSLNLTLGRRSGAGVVGLDIQPGFVAAVQARQNGSIVAERAAAVPLAAGTVRDGEVTDVTSLSETLRQLFADSGLNKRVRVGVANQRTVLRTLELPPVTDRNELAAAVAFVAQDQVPMPLNNAVMDFHALGVIDTPDGPRQRVVLVAAQRDMVERLLAAVRAAGLRPEGVDLSAFALIRSLYRSDAEGTGRVLYLNVDGLTNLAIAEGVACRFTRVVGSGLEGMASEIAERRGIAIAQARELLASVDLTAPEQSAEEHFAPTGERALPGTEPAGDGPIESDPGDLEGRRGDDREAYEARELEMSYDELAALPEAPAAPSAGGPDVRSVLERGVHDIAGEVRNSLDFHSSQHGGGHVSRIIVSGAALDIPGFVDALQAHLHVDVEAHTVGLADESLTGSVSTHRLAIAAGLATTEIAQ